MSSADSALTVDFVRDLDADPTGATPSDNALEALNGLSGTVVVVVPLGEYRFSATAHRIDGPDSLTFVAPESGVPPPEIDQDITRPRFVAPGKYADRWLDIAARSIRIEGIDIDRHAFGAGPQIRLRARDQLDVSRVTLAGRDDSNRGPSDDTMIDIAVADRGEARINGLAIEHGSWWSADSLDRATIDQSATIGRSGLRVGPRNQGSVTIANTDIAECAGHGVDAFESRGPVTIKGGRYVNNNGAQIRSTHPGDVIEDATVRVDLDTVSSPDRSGREIVQGFSPEAYTSLSGVVFDRTDGPATAVSAGTLRDSTIRIASVAGEMVEVSTGVYELIAGPAVAVRQPAGGPTVERSDLIVDVGDIEALAASSPSRDAPTDDGAPNRVTIRNTTMGGDAVAGTAVVVRGRDVRFRGGRIERPGDRRPDDLPSGTVPKRVNFGRRSTGEEPFDRTAQRVVNGPYSVSDEETVTGELIVAE